MDLLRVSYAVYCLVLAGALVMACRTATGRWTLFLGAIGLVLAAILRDPRQAIDARIIFVLVMLVALAPLALRERRRAEQAASERGALEASPADEAVRLEATLAERSARRHAEDAWSRLASGLDPTLTLEERITGCTAVLCDCDDEELVRQAAMTRAVARCEAGEIAGAIADFEIATPGPPLEVVAPGYLPLQLLTGDDARIRAGLDAVLALAPGCILARFERAFRRLASSDCAGAEADYDAALALRGEDPYGLTMRAIARHRQGRAMEAASDLVLAKYITDWFDPQAWTAAAGLALRDGDRVAARAALDCVQGEDWSSLFYALEALLAAPIDPDVELVEAEARVLVHVFGPGILYGAFQTPPAG